MASSAGPEQFARAISWLCGWVYFTAWTLSFIPQPLLNYRRKTTQGSMPDFPLLNIFGFSCYSLSTTLFLYSPVIRKQYAKRHSLSPEPTVRFNDLVFGLFGLTMSFITYSQYWPRLWGWERQSGVKRRANMITLGLIWGSLLGLTTITAIVIASGNGSSSSDARTWVWLDVIYSMQYVKLLLTVFKYIPQVVENFRRKSTLGWSIAQQLMDLTGGVLSLVQLVIDSSLQADWTGLSGNPLKLGLANMSLLFDTIFIVQHYCLYGPVEEHVPRKKASIDSSIDAQDDRQPLMSAGQ
ncbi:L-cystine transporter like protein [Zymoseptoria brevis]|uniref:L-cystine transporter like protein n=1 Tax=Zymoseptoria brevis TaxID=1047168 RepID=A0A0F4GIG9_9PEZI|nr:L-cystine transporter like protein [Zymoseptoria brevis]